MKTFVARVKNGSRFAVGVCAAFWIFAVTASASLPQSQGARSAAQREQGLPVLQLAKNRVETGARLKPPVRGSSAELSGGSSADRYGGSTADKRAVGGRRDIRLLPVKKKAVDKANKSAGKDENADEQDKELEADQEKESGKAKAKKQPAAPQFGAPAARGHDRGR